MPHTYSPFWLDYAAGRIRLSAIFADRDVEPVEVEPHPAEAISLETWCNRMSEAQRNAIVSEYAQRRPRAASVAKDRAEPLAALAAAV